MTSEVGLDGSNPVVKSMDAMTTADEPERLLEIVGDSARTTGSGWRPEREPTRRQLIHSEGRSRGDAGAGVAATSADHGVVVAEHLSHAPLGDPPQSDGTVVATGQGHD